MEEINQPLKVASDKQIQDFLQEMKQPCLFDNTKYYRLRSSLVELVEEIKLKRVTEQENEEKIRLLVQEKHELERKHESKQEEIRNLSDDHDHKLQEQQRHLYDQIHSLKEQVKKLQVHRDINDKETKMLKDDIRSLQWTKYNLEKKLREQEHKLSAHHMSSDQHHKEVSTIGKKMADMMSHYQHLADTLKRLEQNVKAAVSHNKKLMYVNEHKNCETNEIKTKNEKLMRQVLEANVRKHLPAESPEAADLASHLEDLQRQLKHEEEKSRKIQFKADENHKQYEDVLKLLQEAHELTDKHLGNANKHQKESQQYRQKCNDLDQKIVTLNSEIEELRKELLAQKIKYEDSLVHWAQKERNLTLEVHEMKEKMMGKDSEILNLEDVNSLWAAKNVELSTRLEEAEKKVNVEKVNQETQMGTSQLSLRTEGTQTRLTSQDDGSQTEPKSTKSVKTQCIIAALLTAGTQTFSSGVHAGDAESQTDMTSLEVTLDSDSNTKTAFTKTRLDSASQTDTKNQAEKSSQADLSSDQKPTSTTGRIGSSQGSKASERPSTAMPVDSTASAHPGSSSTATLQESKAATRPGSSSTATSQDPPSLRRTRTSFQLPTSYSINEKFQAFEKHSDSFRRSDVSIATAFLPTNMAAMYQIPKDNSNQQNFYDEIQATDLVSSNSNPGQDNQSESISSCAPKPKYARMSHLGPGLISSPSLATRKTPTSSPFPSMGMKVVATRRESLSEVKTTLEFTKDSPDVASVTIQKSEIESSVLTTPIVQTNETNLPSANKGILKNPYQYRINTPKSVQFSDKRQERELTPDPDSTHASPELVHVNQNENNPISNQNPQTTTEIYSVDEMFMYKPESE